VNSILSVILLEDLKEPKTFDSLKKLLNELRFWHLLPIYLTIAGRLKWLKETLLPALYANDYSFAISMSPVLQSKLWQEKEISVNSHLNPPVSCSKFDFIWRIQNGKDQLESLQPLTSIGNSEEKKESVELGNQSGPLLQIQFHSFLDSFICVLPVNSEQFQVISGLLVSSGLSNVSINNSAVDGVSGLQSFLEFAHECKAKLKGNDEGKSESV